MKRYILASVVMVLSATVAHASDRNGSIFDGIFSGRDRHQNYDWSYWNRDNDDKRGNYHEGHNGKSGHWDNGKHKGQRDKWDKDHKGDRNGHHGGRGHDHD